MDGESDPVVVPRRVVGSYGPMTLGYQVSLQQQLHGTPESVETQTMGTRPTGGPLHCLVPLNHATLAGIAIACDIAAKLGGTTLRPGIYKVAAAATLT